MQGRRLIVLAAAALAASSLWAVAGVAGTDAPGGDPAPASFRLADGSAGCAFDDGRLACRARDGAAAAVLEAGRARDDADAEVGWDDATRVVLAGESWWHGGYSCRVSGQAIRCASRSGETIRVGRL